MTDLLKCYYSLVQFCPDASRLEAVNVGVVLACPREQFADIIVAKSNERVRRLFGKDKLDLEDLNDAKEALRNRIEHSRLDLSTEEGLSRFAASRGNDLTLTPPRLLRADIPAVALHNLFDELVGGRRQTADSAAPKIPELERMMSEKSVAEKVRSHTRVFVPVVNQHLKAEYSFRNGRLNLIKEHVFHGQQMSGAMRIALEGDLLYTHELPQDGQAQLIVVHRFSADALELRSRVISLFGEYHVRQFAVEELDALRDEILSTAH
jgi:hypothetical protein